jgi:hypothetical protein
MLDEYGRWINQNYEYGIMPGLGIGAAPGMLAGGLLSLLLMGKQKMNPSTTNVNDLYKNQPMIEEELDEGMWQPKPVQNLPMSQYDR